MAMTKAARNGLAIILFFVFVLWISNLDRSPTTSKSARPPIIYRKAPPAKKLSLGERLAAAKKLSLGEYLPAAKRLLRKRSPNEGDVLVALQHLRAILAIVPKHSEAQRLLKEVKRRFPRIERKDFARHRAADILKNPVVVVRKHWQRSGFGTVVLWTVTFRNRSPRRVGDIRYETKYWTETGRVVDKGSGIIGKVIRAGRTRTLEVNDGFVHSDADGANFTIVGSTYLESEEMAKARAERERAAKAARTKARAERERATKAARVKAEAERLNKAGTAVAAAVKAAAVVVFVPDASVTFCLGQNPAYRQYLDLKRLAYAFTIYPPAGASQAEVDEWREKLDRMEKVKEEEREACNDGLRKR